MNDTFMLIYNPLGQVPNTYLWRELVMFLL